MYLNTPNRFLTHLGQDFHLNHLRRLNFTLAVGAEDAFPENNRVLSQLLHDKHIDHQFHVWMEEAHIPSAWQGMVPAY